MIIENRKKDLEIRIYEEEIYEDLQKVYKEKYSKYVNEDNYEIFAYEANTDIIDYNIYYENYQNKNKKNNSEIILKNIDANESFKKFIGKKLNAQSEYYELTKNDKRKMEAIQKYIPFCKYNKGVLSRITQIKNTLSNIKNYINSKKKLENNKQLLTTDILLHLLEIDNKISAIIKYGEIYDLDFFNNVKYYKYINNSIRCKSLNIFEIIQKLKSIANNNQLDKKIKIVNFNNILSFQKKIFYDKFKEISYKIDNFQSLLYENCFNERENIANILLSFYLFISLCFNENMNKRILNYIYLVNLKIRKCKEYLENEKNIKILKMLSDFKSITNIYYDEKSFKETFFISLNQDNEILLQLYKKLLHNEISIGLILNETDKINNLIELLNQNLDKNNKMIKSLFNVL
ncbi:conserved Plasmodium protein, unknown function [Plasmodium gallinaceum]|uniref:Uncharacterized protein n=1 Tax=Plasmodium gallinaceum TaxID=5849 RepID=A0A1J1GPB6_PLAGA|nr:conserved Plasmodium protein, unknown function [Plasmodium gallinaceum]CRG94261.1 conserved Plasmodium protein, unknown function [Plasmodium gallinaceum]